ncbi:MAG: hypothetical protein IPJ71_11885 [Bdellovibrionales bacterium]|nr:hypothetical protein [Bdellovibrionales bacterium]
MARKPLAHCVLDEFIDPGSETDVDERAHAELAELNLRSQGSSSAWFSAHQGERCCRTHV